MAENNQNEIDGVQTLTHIGKDLTALLLTRDDPDNSFSCTWSPRMSPFAALQQILDLGFLSETPADGFVILADSQFKTPNWQDAIEKLRELDNPDIQFLRFDSETRSVTLEAVPGNPNLFCGVGGEISAVDYLDRALVLTAPEDLILPYATMKAKLFP